MAIDGSFRLESELERFLARCPELKSIPSFSTLMEKGEMVAEEEVVHSVAQIVLHPNYTIPLLGCFRPIARRIVEKTVALLRLVPNLRSNSDGKTKGEEDEELLIEATSFEDEEVANIVELYVRRGRGLDLHELACLAFCRALDLAPHLLGLVLSYFKFAPPPFVRIRMQLSLSELSVEAGTHLLNAARTSYRLLLNDPEAFSGLWDWSCFLDLVKQSASLSLGEDPHFVIEILDIRWCAIQILSVIFRTSDKLMANLHIGAEEALACYLRWKEYCEDVSLEKGGWYLESCDQEKPVSNEITDLNHETYQHSVGFTSLAVSSSQFIEIEPPTRSRRLESWNSPLAGDPFVLTSAVKKGFEMVLLAVSQKWPVLLYGPAGAGKTALISKFAHDSGNRVLSIHMDDQIDSKTLIGSYVCTEQPGEFKWQPGSLTQAVLNGFWVIFEDIDKAPTDVQSILLPLLEGASTFVSGLGEAIRVAEGFRLFSTISSYKLDASRSAEVGVLWRKVMIGPPSKKDLQDIVKAWYPNLEPLAEKLIETFERVNAASVHQVAGLYTGDFNSCCRFSLRDLLKWCKRIAGLGFSSMGDCLSAYERNYIYLEAVDIFAAFSNSIEHRLSLMKGIAKMWALPDSAAETLYPLNKPIIQDSLSETRIGRISLHRTQTTRRFLKKPFAGIRSSLHVLERIACSVKFNEPVLLVGETGTGKTTLVQNLALRLGQKLTVLNLSQQSDVGDLLGGFKPMDAQMICIPLYKEFEILFSKTFSVKNNSDFLARLQKHLSDKNWKMLLIGCQKGADFYQKSAEGGRSSSGKKRKKLLDEDVLKAWEKFTLKLEAACGQISTSSGMLFSFVEGAFVTAVRNGEWILLDEVNLAPPETLQRIVGVLEGERGSFCLAERGDVDYINRHPNFRIFACMNPATDAGKRDLSYSLRIRFTEYFVDDVLDDEDLSLFIKQFMDDSDSDRELVIQIVRFYKKAKKESDERLQDGANQKPQYSLRSLYRALEYTQKARRDFKFPRALYDGFSMFFLTLLDGPSAKLMNQLIVSCLLGGHIPPHVTFNDYLVEMRTSGSDDFLKSYVLTKSVNEHLRNLARAIFIKRYPVLLQGPTSSGKTSLVQYLATITGHEFVRINNHEHTDLQEYLGSYVTDTFGKLVFNEGVLVKAVRNGYWIVLDELNLAPSDVLEALNRLLDDNRELFVPELRETVHAHPDFMLFATQNPPTFYGGRKMLSRAFRNRFVEIHVDEIPEEELSTILEKRCGVPQSYAFKMVEVMKELQLHRQSSKVFAGKHGFITPRDLFRWADRYRTFEGKSYEDLAKDGYYLLAERLRNEVEKSVVQEVLEKHLRIKLVKDDLYKQEPSRRSSDLSLREYWSGSKSLGNITLTQSMWRLLFLVERCYTMREPVLLVGETGGGKTTVCQLLSIMLGLKLHILNCHQYTETADFLGGFHPIRERSRIASEYTNLVELLMLSKAFICFPDDVIISSDIGQACLTLDRLYALIKSYQEGRVSCPDVTAQDYDTLVQMTSELAQLNQQWQAIFMWHDGPLVHAMTNGDLFLVDEISLADDSVLERLNSVLEPGRTLSLAEKGGSDLEKITAHPNFFPLATMNPGGDYGKKELSPALRNRFTEIWVPAVNDLNELRSISLQRISTPKPPSMVDPMLKFLEWFNQLEIGRTLTVRDLLSWISFINVTQKSLKAEYALVHGLFLVLLDGLSLGTGISKNEARELREKCFSILLEELKVHNSAMVDEELSRMGNYGWGDLEVTADISCSDMKCDNLFGINPFFIEKGDEYCKDGGFNILAPTTRRNALRVLRAMQLAKPVLLEGSPGVGKTSLIVALGKFSGHRVVRINLSEQTDMMDLLGSDLPIESQEGMKFAWSDGILLQALKKGFWVLLDELNLAPQSVLEGLNAILDHRAEVFIPELGRTFKCPPSFRVFACQNPSYQGGGRKGLPKSFLNRFTKVYVDELVDDDYLSITRSLFPLIPDHLLTKLILFNKRLYEETMLDHKFAQDGSPWEFNLRDVIRSCQIIQGAPGKFKYDCFLNIVYVQRMRTASDRREVLRLYEQVFEVEPFINPYPRVQLNPQYLIVGNTALVRNRIHSVEVFSSQLKVLPGIRNNLEAAAECVQHQWLCILIGPPSSGKTSLIRLLAQLTGNVLNELNLSPATDISELLGCFEQYNAFRKFRSVVSEVECYFNEFCSLQLAHSIKDFIDERKDLVTRWFAFLSIMGSGNWTPSASVRAENCRSILDSLCLLDEIIETLRSFLVHIEQRNILSVSWSHKDLSTIQKAIMKLQEHFQTRRFSAKFEWVTGLLIKAIESGEWIVLENANLCNPTVLDRINSLVEPHGSITVNECGIVDGKPVTVHPHPNFRMFLTVNPTYGEVSRAMRNRGIEIFLMQPSWLLDGGSDCSQGDIELKDMKRFLVLAGIPIAELVDAMAKAHAYVKIQGLRLNVHITYLELARWVQLFQQLIINGNRPMWSLQISWEHTYLSSLGETEGREIIAHAKTSFLSGAEISVSQSGLSFCLPGGWPRPLMLKDMVLYSKEASVRQNCMYLEYLGAQCASDELCIARNTGPTSNFCSRTYLVNMKMLYQVVLPKCSNGMVSCFSSQTELNLALANKMLLFASNWTFEQATESDFNLYLLWFSWFRSQVQPFCEFFDSFVTVLKQELKHPIWNCIIRYRQELLSCLGIMGTEMPDASLSETYRKLDLDMQPVPMLSLELVVLTASNENYKTTSQRLCNAIKSVCLLRLSFQQWNAEDRHDHNEKTRSFIPLLRSLRMLEEEVLSILVESPSFDLLFQIYTNLLEDHISFWNFVKSSHFDYLLTSWRSLLRNAIKLQNFCFEAAKMFLTESRNLEKVSSWHLSSQKSMLWVHGGHPFLPPSSDLYYKQQQLLSFCESLWPTKTKSRNMDALASNKDLLEVVVSCKPQLRLLAMQGVCMSSYIMGKCSEENTHIVQQMDEMYQMLLGRVGHEKQKLEVNLGYSEHESLVKATCCVFRPEVLCSKSVFDSWQEVLPVINSSGCYLDMEILQELSKIVLLDTEGSQALSRVSKPLETALNFSLNFTTRPPTNFVPHQKILWLLDAWLSVDAANVKLASFALEMWFSWHWSLWSLKPVSLKNLSKTADYDVPLPDILFQPIRLATVVQILESAFAIKDYLVQSLKIRAASQNFWRSYPPSANLSRSLSNVARSLLQQIIYAHKKSFEADKYSLIKSFLSSFEKNTVTHENIQIVSSLIASSGHHKLTGLIDLFIEPLLRELYLQCSTTEFLHNLGCAWLRIGGLRFHLLLIGDDLDPAMKYSCKYSQLVEKISLLELEMKVREECDYLVGWFSTREADKEKLQTLNSLEVERKNLQRRLVFRSDPGKFKKLKYECDEFLKVFMSLMVIVKNVGGMDLKQMTDQVRNWQETASSFVDRLSDEYPSYIDIIQPVQVAVFEMKLGLSLVVSGALQKEFLEKVENDNMDKILETIYSFMRFPRGCVFKSITVNVRSTGPEFPCYNVDFPTDSWAIDMVMLEKLVTITKDVSTDSTVSVLQLKAAIYQNTLVRAAHFVINTRVLDSASFMLLDEIFNRFASLWMNMKEQAKNKQDQDTQQFKFRPRAFKIESIFDVDISTLGDLSGSESFVEWQESLSEEELNKKKEAVEEHESIVEDWNLLQESILKKLVHTHSHLFGSIDLSSYPGRLSISDAERLLSFTDSYTLGVEMIKGLEGFSSTSLDAKLVPEHLLRLSVEHEQKFIWPHKSSCMYNFYKDSNSPMMAKMVKLLTTLRERVLALLNEWEEHPGLQKILEVVEMLMAIPASTPLSKALSGLNFLLNKARMLQDNVSRFSLSDQLEPILVLASSWQRLEFDSWPALLDEVQDQYDINAGKLWFPLYSVLQRRHSYDIEGYSQFMIQSLEEFIQTSSVGEFRKRLHLLYAFHGQIDSGICLGFHTSPCQMETLKILYNLFGFYMRTLPAVSEQVAENRKTIERDLGELLKLCRWERPEDFLSIDMLKRTKQKLKKLIQKYDDLLQQPVMLIIGQATPQREIKYHPILGKNEGMPSDALDMSQFNEDRCMWFADWRKKVKTSLHNMLEKASDSTEEYTTKIRECLTSESECIVYAEEYKELWYTLEKICRTAVSCGELWKGLNRSVGKRRALSELLKMLESCGLSRHKHVFLKDQQKSIESNDWCLQPSFDMKHLLITQGRSCYGDVDASAPKNITHLPDEGLDTEWRLANQYYFRSIASVLLLRQISLNFHKDVTLEQVNRSGSFLDHLMVIQQEQRAAVYGFAEQLRSLRKYVSSLENFYVYQFTSNDNKRECSVIPNKHATFKCMWQQKLTIDSLCAMLHEDCLLLRTIESSHLNSCHSVKAEANRIIAFIEKVVPVFQKSKEVLDNFLIGHEGERIALGVSLHPYVISRDMEQLVFHNFQALREFEEHLFAFRKLDVDKTVKEALLSHFEEIIEKGKLIEEEFFSSVKTINMSTTTCEETSYCSLEAGFGGALNRLLKHIADAFQTLCSFRDPPLSEESIGNITSWKILFESKVADMKLDVIRDALHKTILTADNWLNLSGNESVVPAFQIGVHFRNLYQLLDPLLNFGEGLLQDFLAMHRTVSMMTCELASLFASLFSEGYGTSAENQGDDASHDKSQDASGTGMGEGAGVKDVSDQITDEDQLLGTEKQSDEQDASNEVPSKDDRGIEMEEDFAADAFSVSEESGEDNEESEDEQLESAMGETGLDSEVVDEKLWNKKEDEDPNSTNEKYETGPSVRDKDTGSRELRAKEDSAMTADDPGELNPDEVDSQNDENGSQDSLGGAENMEDMKMDKEEAFADPTELKPDEQNQDSKDDMELDEQESAEPTEEACPEEHDKSDDNANSEEEGTNPMDQILEEAESEEGGGPFEKDNLGKDHEDDSKMESETLKEELKNLGFVNDHVSSEASAALAEGESQAADIGNEAPGAKWSNSSEIYNEPKRGLPSGANSVTEIMVADSSEGGRLTSDQQKAQLPQPESSSVQKTQSNPYRSVGDAVEEWKERVKVSVDLQEDNTEVPDNMEDETADEYGFVSQFEKGMAQALGPATPDQIDKNISSNKPDGDGHTMGGDNPAETIFEKQNSEEHPSKRYISALKSKIEERTQVLDLEKSPMEESPEVQGRCNGDPGSLSESLVSIKRSYMSEDMPQLEKLALHDEDLGKAQNLEPMSSDMKDNGTALWRKYELQTTRLSQELAEQLRLVMEPTLASKLRGDYKTGKRINMKKVIPYIASHYRKDKIWLRRTRPNKRDYQVVIAIDDSRSMSESSCGDVAIEALVTVCRAMSQLEMGNLAVTSFGKKGNIRLLHDFDQPFTGESGVKMISSLTFKQENTIADEPVVDLLKYMNNMLDSAVSKARLPSGQNPLQQLVLIIADGRFHEKENLKRCVRDVLSRKRMVAFLLIDSPQESIMDLMEASFQGGNIKFTKYLDSFPFPYYIVLKNIEALPRTLADLLRQWFELMQHSRD